MRLVLFLLATFLIAVSGSIQAQESGIGPGRPAASDPLSWRRYTVKDEEFSVILPTLPAMTTSKVLRSSDRKPHMQRLLETSLDGVVYNVQGFENPKPRQSLEEFIADQRKTLELDPASERSLTVSGFAGKEYLSLNKTSATTVQFFATETRLYRFSVSGPGAGGSGAKEFFSSIRLGINPYGVEVSDGPGLPLESESGNRIFKGSEVDKKPKLLRKPEPYYADVARSDRVGGTVILRVVFAKTGRVENIHVIKGLPNGLTERAVEAAKRITFVPATKDDQYVSMWMQLEYNFSPF
jgi:TonB family protein